MQDQKATTIEYSNRSSETPFQTFLRYTDEKEKSAKVLGGILRTNIVAENTQVLDIGSGTGEYVRFALEEAGISIPFNLTLLEPSPDLLPALRGNASMLSENINHKIVTDTWEDYKNGVGADIILASHLYHIPREKYEESFGKMVSTLKTGGSLVYVLRQVDDSYHFKTKFKPMIHNRNFVAKTLDQALETFQQISAKTPLEINTHQSVSQLNIPYEVNREDTEAIVEFYLQKPWKEITPIIQKQIQDYIRDKKGVFNQVDGLAVIKKL